MAGVLRKLSDDICINHFYFVPIADRGGNREPPFAMR
jgi:hypothetical protein